MRIIVFFDLPTETVKDRKNYSCFRKFLINEGFIMMQESVYTKLALNSNAINLIRMKLDKNMPPKGIVQSLTITEKQFNSSTMHIGNKSNKEIDNTERLIII